MTDDMPRDGSDQTQDHWPELARLWELSGPPLRPSVEDLRGYQRCITQLVNESGALRVLLLGVTPELYQLPWPSGTDFLAVDRSQAMIDNVWPGPADAAKREDWTTLTMPEGSRDLVLCDGGLHLLSYPDGQIALVRSLSRIVRPGGSCVLRLFVPPAEAEAVGAILGELRAGRVPSVNVLKLRLGMALQERVAEGVAVEVVWRVFNDAEGDGVALSETIGWPREQIETLTAYRGSPARYHFVSVDEATALFCDVPGGFELSSVSFPGYELGERCPVVSFRRLDD